MSSASNAAMSKTLLFLALIGTLLSLGGGALTLPPFKSLSWVSTPYSLVGIWGACPRITSPAFFALDDEWKSLQNTCNNIFGKDAEPVFPGQLTHLDELIVSGLQAGSAVLAFLALILPSRHHAAISIATLVTTSFIANASSFAYATYRFIHIIADLRQQLLFPEADTVFGIGFYLAGASAVALLGVAITASHVSFVENSGDRNSKWTP